MKKIVLLMSLAFIVFLIATILLILEMLIGLSDYSVIIWNFAIAIVIVIIVITIIKYRKKKKKKEERKEERKVVYFEAEGEEYRTEYY